MKLTVSLPIACLFCVLTLFTASGCTIDQTDEIQMGREAAPQFEKEFGGLYPDPKVQSYVNDVGMRLARQAGRSDLPWQFRVVNSDEINAFALPGGYIYITKGLLFSLENEAQLASILGHEAAHVAHRDSVEQLERQQLISGGVALAGIAADSSAVGDIGQIVGGLVIMKYSRDQEKNADLAGLDYMVRAGYDPDGMVDAMEIMRKKSGGKGPPEFFSTHPDPENREEYLRERIKTRYGNMISTGHSYTREFQQNVPSRDR